MTTRERLEDDVKQSIRAIERVVENFGVLKESFRFYKDAADDLRARLEAETAQHEEIQREIAALERDLTAERERALRAEGRVSRSDETVRELQGGLAAARSQIGRLTKAISLLAEADAEARGSPFDEPQRAG